MLSNIWRAGIHIVFAGMMASCLWVMLILTTPVDLAATWLFFSGALGFSYLVWRYRGWIYENYLDTNKLHFMVEKTLTSFGIGSAIFAISFVFFYLSPNGDIPFWEDIGVLFFLGALISMPAYLIYSWGKGAKPNRIQEKLKGKPKQKPKLKNNQLDLDQFDDDYTPSLGELIDDDDAAQYHS